MSNIGSESLSQSSSSKAELLSGNLLVNCTSLAWCINIAYLQSVLD